jgi:hypothetical protein
VLCVCVCAVCVCCVCCVSVLSALHCVLREVALRYVRYTVYVSYGPYAGASLFGFGRDARFLGNCENRRVQSKLDGIDRIPDSNALCAVRCTLSVCALYSVGSYACCWDGPC